MSIVLTDISVTELSQIPIFHVHPGLDYHLRACAVDVDNGVATAPEVDGVEATTAAARIVADLPSRHISAAAHPTDNNEKNIRICTYHTSMQNSHVEIHTVIITGRLTTCTISAIRGSIPGSGMLY